MKKLIFALLMLSVVRSPAPPVIGGPISGGTGSGGGSGTATNLSGNALVQVTNTATYLSTNRQGVFNVLDYGAVRGGVVDTSTNIQQAIFAAELAGGGTVYMPAGVYGIGTTNALNEGFYTEGYSAMIFVRSNVPIRFLGDGMGQTVLRSMGNNGDYRILFATGGTTNGPVNYTTNFWSATGNLDFSNFTIDGDTNAFIYDFTELFTHGTVTFNQVEFLNSGLGDAMDVAGNGAMFVTGCRSLNMAGNITSTQVKNLFVSDCTFDSGGTRLELGLPTGCFNNSDVLASYENVTVNNYSTIFRGDATQFFASNCRFIGTNVYATNFHFGLTYLPTFTGCIFEGPARNAIVTTGRGLKLIGCDFRMTGNDLQDILCIKPSELLIEGCTFGDVTSPQHRANIMIQDGQRNSNDGKGTVKILNNSFMDYYYGPLDAIQFLGTNGAYNALISGNIFANKNVKLNSATNVVFVNNNWTTNGTLLATNMDFSIITGNRFQSAPTLTLGNANNEIKNNIGLENSVFTGNGSGLTSLPAAQLTGYIQPANLSSNIPYITALDDPLGIVDVGWTYPVYDFTSPSWRMTRNGGSWTNLNVSTATGTLPSTTLPGNVVTQGFAYTLVGTNLIVNTISNRAGTHFITNNANGFGIDRAPSVNEALGVQGRINSETGYYLTGDAALTKVSSGMVIGNSVNWKAVRQFVDTVMVMCVTNSRVGILTEQPTTTLDVRGGASAYTYSTPTNSATHAPNFALAVQTYVTNDVLVLTAPTGIDSTKYQEMLFVVINSDGTPRAINTAGLLTCRTNAAANWWVTNVTEIKFTALGNHYTNAFASPRF